VKYGEKQSITYPVLAADGIEKYNLDLIELHILSLASLSNFIPIP
jgi:hypothetical protein